MTELFDSQLLAQLDYSQCTASFPVDSARPGALGGSLVMRPLHRTDFHKGYINLLRQLTTVGDLTEETFVARFDQMKSQQDSYYIVVIEDTATQKLITTGTLLVELKFIHNAAKRGHVEDVVVDVAYRGHQLGKIIIEALKTLSEHVGCYKVSLDCKSANVGFYEKCGFQTDEVHFMWKRFHE